MPRGDNTGPEGRGSKTGRGMGYCSGYSTPGFTKGLPRGGGGYGRGRGRGLNFRSNDQGYSQVPRYNNGIRQTNNQSTRPVPQDSRDYGKVESQGDEVQALKDEARMLEERLNEINQRMDELKD